MSISYPLTLPSTPGFSRLVLKTQNVVGLSASPFTGQQNTYLHPGEWWMVEATLPPMTRAAAEEWISFLLSLRGQSGTFLFGATVFGTARGVATGTPLVKGAAQTGTSLITDGWTHNVTGILKAGDFIQLGTTSTSRLHKNLKDVNSDNDGDATLDLYPRLRASPTDDSTIVVSSPKGVFRLASNNVEVDVDSAQVFGLGFSAIEAF